MNGNNRPQGREKRVGPGSGSVKRRGVGQSGRTGGPVGSAGGYSGRTGGFSGPSGGTSRGRGADREGGANRGSGDIISPILGLFSGKGKSSNKLVWLVIVIAAIFLISKFGGGNLLGDLMGGDSNLPSGNFQSAPGNSSLTYVDQGAYAADKSVSELARAKRTVLQGGGKDTVTVMLYMCGTDLESKAGMATSDIQEILYAEISDKVNIIAETGGTAQWQNNVIKSDTNQRYKLTNDGLELLQDNMGRKSMVDPDTLSDFIKYCKKNYPADRYALIFWDHGGGSLTGYGYDQHFAKDSMTLDEIAKALKNGGCSFDFVGFDACLMATLETAVVLEPYADYMIASEEVEPGIGWHYTGWITELSKNTSIPTVDLGKKLIDDYIKEVNSRTPESQATLSIIDLAEVKGTVPSSLAAFAKAANELMDEEKYETVSDARAGAKEFAASSGINQIDLIHFAENIGTAESKALAETLRGCVKYNRSTTNISNSNGVSIYFPYGNTTQVSSMLNTYDKIGMAEEYSECVKSFANLTAGGQITSFGSGNLLNTLLNGLSGGSQGTIPTQNSDSNLLSSLLNSFLSGGDYSSITGLAGDALGNWLDTDRIRSSLDYYEENRLDPSYLILTEKNGRRVLSLPEEQWDLIHFMEMNVFIDDGEGFIDLGLDNIYEYNDDGDLIMEYDGTWISLNGQIVSYYMVSIDRNGDAYSIKGRIPVLLNNEPADIIVVFDNENPYGTVLGAQIRYDAGLQTATVAKGLFEIRKGDKIDFLSDYYTYEGEYSDTYFLGEQYTATGEWEIYNKDIGTPDYQMTYRITDIYGNQYWTPSITD